MAAAAITAAVLGDCFQSCESSWGSAFPFPLVQVSEGLILRLPMVHSQHYGVLTGLDSQSPSGAYV
jgi:hypothetical protein